MGAIAIISDQLCMGVVLLQSLQQCCPARVPALSTAHTLSAALDLSILGLNGFMQHRTDFLLDTGTR